MRSRSFVLFTFLCPMVILATTVIVSGQASQSGHSASIAGHAASTQSPSAGVKLPVVFPAISKSIHGPEPKAPTEAQLLPRANSGDVDAMVKLADLLPSPKDLPWYIKAGDAGNLYAIVRVVGRYRGGDSGIDKNPQAEQEWIHKAAPLVQKALNQQDGEKLSLAAMLYPGGSPEREKYVLAAARAGAFEHTNFASSVVIEEGFPIGPERTQLLQKCVDDGHPECLGRVADTYLLGKGVPADASHALDLYRKRAEAGEGAPDMSVTMHGIPPKEVLALWKIAIEHGGIRYALNLADAYCSGNSVPKSGAVAMALISEVERRSTGYDKARAITQKAQMHLNGRCLPVNQQLFLRDLNAGSSADEQARRFLGAMTEGWARGIAGIFRAEAENVLPQGPAALIMLKNMAANGIPYNGAEETYLQYKANIILGTLYFDGRLVKQSYTDALAWYQKAETIATSSAPSSDGFDNDGDAENHIGVLYGRGLGVPKDISVAMNWYEKAARHKNSLGEDNLAGLILATSHQQTDISRAMQLLRSSADKDNPTAENELGTALSEGKYLPRDYAEAARLFQQSSIQGNARATLNLAALYYGGLGVARDQTKGIALYQQASDQGDVMASIELGGLYYKGSSVPKDVSKAFGLYKKAAEAGVPIAEMSVGYMYQKGEGVGQDLAAAVNWYQKAAAQGQVQADLYLANMYRDGSGVAQDIDTAKALYSKAAASDDSESELNLADMAGASSDQVQAAQWYRKASDHGVARAQFSYAYLLEHGQGVAQNDAEAARYYQAAANQNFAAAENNLGMMYEQGRGVGQDQQRALRLFQLAEANGDNAGRQNAQQLGDLLQQQRQVADARAAAERAQQDAAERQEKIANLRSDIETQESSAASYEESANQLANTNNCSGAVAALCQTLSDAGAAKQRQKANQARNRADEDRSEIERLEGLEVQARQSRDTSYMGNLAQAMNSHPNPTIQDTLAEQQSQFNAMAVAAQQRQAAVAQANLDRLTATRQAQSSTLQNTLPTRKPSTATSSQTTSARSRLSVISAPTASATSSAPMCRDVTYEVTSRVSWHGPTGAFCAKELDVFFTNTASEAVSCTWAYMKDGVWHNYGGATMQPGQTVGGGHGGEWTCAPDSGEIRYMCFPKAEAETKYCGKQLPSDWK